MADVRRNRAQLVIVGGLVIAVALVAVGLLLNFAIYTENLATREGNTEAASAVEQRDAAVDAVAEAMEFVNSNEAGSGTGVMYQQLLDQVAVFNESMRKRGAIGGAAVEVTDVSVTNGSRMRQTEFGRNFTDLDEGNDGDPDDLFDPGRDPDWTLVENVNTTSRFRMELDRSGLAEVSSTSTFDIFNNTLSSDNQPFHVEIENQTDPDEVWKVYMYRDGQGTAYLAVQEPTDPIDTPLLALTDVCMASADNITVDFVNNQFGGSSSATTVTSWQVQQNSLSFTSAQTQGRANCDVLDFFPAELGDDEYEIRYRSGQNAFGTYDLIVDSTDVKWENFQNVSDGPGQPFAYEALFTATVNVSYRSSDVRFSDSVETSSVANLSEFPGISPKVTEFDVTDDQDSSDSGVEFGIDWRVEDGDGNLQKVNVTLINRNTSEVTHEEFTFSNVSTASNTTMTLSQSGLGVDEDDEFTVRIVAFDHGGNIATRAEVKTNDT